MLQGRLCGRIGSGREKGAARALRLLRHACCCCNGGGGQRCAAHLPPSALAATTAAAAAQLEGAQGVQRSAEGASAVCAGGPAGAPGWHIGE